MVSSALRWDVSESSDNLSVTRKKRFSYTYRTNNNHLVSCIVKWTMSMIMWMSCRCYDLCCMSKGCDQRERTRDSISSAITQDKENEN